MIPAALRRRFTLLNDWMNACPAGAPLLEDRSACLECDTVKLTSLREGMSCTVSCLEGLSSTHAARLAAMGVLPGTRLRLLQRYPAFVFRIGYAEFAVDETLGSRIGVKVNDGPGSRIA